MSIGGDAQPDQPRFPDPRRFHGPVALARAQLGQVRIATSSATLTVSFNDAAFDSIDYAIYAAKSYGLRVIVPLTDQYQYYRVFG